MWPSLANCWLRMAFVMVPILPWVWRAEMRVLVLVAAYSLVREGNPSPPLSTSWNIVAVGKQSGRLYMCLAALVMILSSMWRSCCV